MNFTPKQVFRCVFVLGLSLFLLAFALFPFLRLGKMANVGSPKEARRILPGYTIIFGGCTNEIQACGSLMAFSKQHEMMEYLQIFAPYVEQYKHPMNHPIMITETEDRVIIELPSRFRFPPYNWTIYWGSPYSFRMEIDKKTKKIVDAVQG